MLSVCALAANLRRAFSGIVAGNVKDEGIRSIEKHGHFEIRGDAAIKNQWQESMGSKNQWGQTRLI